MEFESWMTCEPLATDGETTIGLVNDSAARWSGALSVLQVGESFEYAENGDSFTVDDTTYLVRELVWTRVPPGTKTLYLNRRVLFEYVPPEDLEDLGRTLFVNGKMFSKALQEEGTYIDPVDFKLYEWK